MTLYCSTVSVSSLGFLAFALLAEGLAGAQGQNTIHGFSLWPGLPQNMVGRFQGQMS